MAINTIVNNDVLIQLRGLMTSAITLKEKFDTNLSNDLLKAYCDNYNSRLEEVRRICPKEVLSQGSLLRHSGFLKMYLDKGQRENCYSDVVQICTVDIFHLEECFLSHLMSANITEGRFYDWNNIHPVIQSISKKRFEDSQYADAVEAGFKQINKIIKAELKKRTKKELDGDDLMKQAFSSNEKNSFTPNILLADNSTRIGRDIQIGYMNIFSGCIMGIRNPKAHDNLNVHPDEAWEMIVLASHLMRMYDKFNK